MIPSIFLVYSFFAMLLFLFSIYGVGETRGRITGLTSLLSTILSYMLMSACWNIYTIIPVYDGSVPHGAISEVSVLSLETFEANALAGFWFAIGTISLIMTMAAFLDAPKKELEDMNIRM